MNSNNQTTLGISLGTRTIGYVILQERNLYDWGVKSFRSRWSPEKLQKILKTIEVLIEENDVTNVSIKVPNRYETHQSLQELHSTLCKNFNQRVHSLFSSSLNNLRLWYSIDNRSPKSNLEAYVKTHYPVLCKSIGLSDAGRKYHLKLYEALAAAEMSHFLK